MQTFHWDIGSWIVELPEKHHQVARNGILLHDQEHPPCHHRKHKVMIRRKKTSTHPAEASTHEPMHQSTMGQARADLILAQFVVKSDLLSCGCSCVEMSTKIRRCRLRSAVWRRLSKPRGVVLLDRLRVTNESWQMRPICLVASWP